MDLKGKVAIITGAQRGIGQACAIKLAESGAKIAVTDISEENCQKVVEQIEQNGGEAVAFKMDVTDVRDIEEVKKAILSKWGEIDILVNNAGIFDYEELEDISKIDKILNVDLKGLMVVTKIFAPEMVKQNFGKIINISSVAGLLGSPRMHSYCTAKAGVMGFTRAMALELGPMGINVNCVAPGAIETSMLTQVGIDPKVFLPMVPMRRIGKPIDIANAVAFLSSDEASYISGQVITVDGGYTIM